MGRFYSTFEVAKICHVSAGSVIRWIKEGKIEASMTAGGHHRISESALHSLLKQLNIPAPSNFSKEKFKVLVVDDEPGVRKILRRILETNFDNVLVEEAEEGFVAGWRAHSLKPDLVFLDLLIPGMDGFRICQFIRSFAELKDTKIIAITGMQTQGVKDKVLKLGADDFLNKPFEIETIKQKVNDCMAA